MNSIFEIGTDDIGFDTYSGAVVIAKSADAAKALWLSCFDSLERKPSIASVKAIGKTKDKARIVLTSFHAG